MHIFHSANFQRGAALCLEEFFKCIMKKNNELALHYVVKLLVKDIRIGHKQGIGQKKGTGHK